MHRLAKSVVRVVLQLPLIFVMIVLLPFLLVAALVGGIRNAYRALELWAFYDGDEDARKKDEWKR